MYADPIVHENSYFGRGLDVPVWSEMECSGWEDNVNECKKQVYPWLHCYAWGHGVAGVECRDSEWY